MLLGGIWMAASRKTIHFFSLFILLLALPVFAADTDGDGLADDVELQLGSSPTHKDIFVYINYMIWNGKNLRPRGNFIKIAQDVFSTAPVNNPDGRTGITLHVQIGPAIRATGNAGVIFSWAEFDAIKNRYFPASKRGTHHYCLFAGALGDIATGEVTGISGLSRNGSVFRQGASDSIVSLGHPGWFNHPNAANFKWTQAGTFLHELGHNLGLMHGGNDHISNKPNHLSLMSYAYQTDGIPIDVPNDGLYYLYDFGRFAGPNLNEANLNENVGMGPRLFFDGIYYGARWWIDPDFESFLEVFDATEPVDWNNNGVIQSGVRFNLNQRFDDKFNNLRGGINEWLRIFYRGGQIGKSSHQTSMMPSEFLYRCLDAPKRRSVSAMSNVRRITFQELKLKLKN
jgi:hypothetical protein